jgi:HAD superfamily hydrolase (TIGR01509 family)
VVWVRRGGCPPAETVAALNLQFSTALDPALVVELQRATFRSLLTQVTAIEPVVAFARAMALRAPVGVASGGHRQEVEASLRNVGLDGVFRTIVTGDDVLRGKPDPEIFLRCAEGLGVPASECLVIEDGEFGIEAARRAGMPWVRVEAYAMSESLGAS